MSRSACIKGCPHEGLQPSVVGEWHHPRCPNYAGGRFVDAFSLTDSILRAIREHGAPSRFHALEVVTPECRLERVAQLCSGMQDKRFGTYKVSYFRRWFTVMPYVNGGR